MAYRGPPACQGILWRRVSSALAWLVLASMLAACALSPAPGGSPSVLNPTATVQATPAATMLPSATSALSPSPSTIAPTASALPAVTATPGGNAGYLEGRASIGPLQPVERVGEPTPTPAPEVCTSRGITILDSEGRTEVTSFNLRPDCTYRVALNPGKYVVQLRQRGGVGGSKDLPKTVVIEAGKTVRLDLDIDTGIR